jgi:hypothetical protein
VCIFPGLVSAQTSSHDAVWLEKYIAEVPPILMQEPFLELYGQVDQPVPYYFYEAVKAAGHSCGAGAGAWTITRKALEELYPDTTPVRGQLRVIMPGAEDEWFIGVFGKVISFITGAEPKTGFPGAEFGEAFNRRNLMIYTDAPQGTPPPQMLWIFERLDTRKKVAVRFDLTKVQPPATPAFREMSAKVAAGKASPEEAAQWRQDWNMRVRFIFENADVLPGLFTVKPIQEMAQ